MENVIRIGSVVYSKRGRDAGGYFMVSEIRDADFVFIADGHTHKLARPKKKNIKHLKNSGHVLEGIAEKLIAEKEGIFLWMLEGLRRLIANHYHFTISQRAKDNITSAVRYANNILDFLDSEGYVAFKADYEASTKNLYAAYKRWCEDNAENPLSPKSFANQLSQNAERYHLEPVNNLHIGGGKRCRGYMGIYVLLSPVEL